MELTYQVRGTDGQTYGPVTLAELKDWLRQGRVDEETQILRSDTANWEAAARFSELGLAAARPAAFPSTAPPPVRERAEGPVDDPEVQSAASWFYWIVGLSAINSLAAHTGMGFSFFLGLAITALVDYGSGSMVFALVVDAVVYGLFVVLGLKAARGARWAFIVGMILYALDGALYLIGQQWFSVAFHGYALYCLFKGLQALNASRA